MASTQHHMDVLLGQVIRSIGQKRGLSQGDLACLVGVDRKTINRLENGHHSMSDSALTAFAQSVAMRCVYRACHENSNSPALTSGTVAQAGFHANSAFTHMTHHWQSRPGWP